MENIKSSPLQLIAFYQFTPLEATYELKNAIKQLPELQPLKGTILLAKEGINATLAGPASSVEKAFHRICQLGRFDQPSVNHSSIQQIPFTKLKIKIKKEIVTLLHSEADASSPQEATKQITKLTPTQWNALLLQEKILLLDIRNDFEYAMGSFVNAVNPRINSFSELPQFLEKNLCGRAAREGMDKKLAIFCTGGIRCDKLALYLQGKSAYDIYFPEGGIIRYLKEIPPKDCLWEGECFVFDDRISIGDKK